MLEERWFNFVDPDEVASQIALQADYLVRGMTLSAGHLLVLAHEYCRNQPYNDRGPVWEFLRHCRNGVAHGGYFNLSPKEPSRAATWAGVTISKTVQGVPVLS